MMQLVYLAPNMAWVFMFGGAPERLDNEDLFFQTRKEAVAAATRKGLSVTRRGVVFITPEVAA